MENKKSSDFRMWVYETYYQNRDEREIHNESPIDVKRYFNTYKWWLKREYFFQKNRK
jgi:hypothetical protein